MIFEPNESLQIPQKPTTMGHEATGQVVGMGASVTGFKAGNNVGFLPAINVCFECYSCKHMSVPMHSVTEVKILNDFD